MQGKRIPAPTTPEWPPEMTPDRATAAFPSEQDFASGPALALVPDNLETLLTGVIARLRSLPDATPDCRRDAVAAIAIGRATGLLTPRARLAAVESR